MTLRRQRFAGAARQRYGLAADCPRLFRCLNYVWRSPAGADCNQDIARNCQSLHLPREDFLIAVIVAERSQRRSVGGKRDGREGLPLSFISPDQLGRNVLRIGGAAAISAKQDLIARAKRLADKPSSCINLG